MNEKLINDMRDVINAHSQTIKKMSIRLGAQSKLIENLNSRLKELESDPNNSEIMRNGRKQRMDNFMTGFKEGLKKYGK